VDLLLRLLLGSGCLLLLDLVQHLQRFLDELGVGARVVDVGGSVGNVQEARQTNDEGLALVLRPELLFDVYQANDDVLGQGFLMQVLDCRRRVVHYGREEDLQQMLFQGWLHSEIRRSLESLDDAIQHIGEELVQDICILEYLENYLQENRSL